MQFHQYTEAAILEMQQTSRQGLTMEDVQKRRQKYGPNELQEKKKVPTWLLFLQQFKDFMILILAIAAVLS
ncbi:MAG: hypothetical protein JNN28_14045, partial [Saprospiraceae bacterium]|nr:hypothetical protein [Saprospiraceae bacterium]